jgi:hypothetical protein
MKEFAQSAERQTTKTKVLEIANFSFYFCENYYISAGIDVYELSIF